ncbi:TPA: TolC family protein [Providencia rettgeri]|uniref:TolC family protein n=1 Tax=Providencia sp. PROV129 TaxID=2949839 RepID=UPI002349AEDB|nr:TolC family protein [Providencia sp. PROV129]HEC8330320.1 TolC family protein [Providencia rettgeri]
MYIKNIITGLTIALITSNFSFAESRKEHFDSFIARILDNSTPIQIKKLELEAETYRAKQTEYFYAPKLTATTKVKKHDNTANSQLTATSLVYDSALHHRFNEKNLKISAAKLLLAKEKEDLYASITNNLIGIHFLNELTKTTSDLHHNAQDIFSLINRRYQSGIAKMSDVEQATLLMQRLETEQKNIKTEIDQYKSNIELTSGILFPKDGVLIPQTLIKQLSSTVIDNKNIENSTELNILSTQANVMKESAYQQNSLFNVHVIAEERYVDKQKSYNESYIGLEVKFNILDLDKKMSEIAQLKVYDAAINRKDYKHKEIIARIKNLQLISSSNDIELSSLKAQLKTMNSIIKSKKREYEISQSSFYEMVNTLFDMLTIERKITELMISDIKNKIEYLQLTGRLIKSETPD